MKRINGLNSFDSNAEAKKAREKALKASASWKTALLVSLIGSIVSLVFLHVLELSAVGMVISAASWIAAEVIGGRCYWRFVFKELFSGTTGLQAVLFFLVYVFLAALYGFFFVFLASQGFGFGILLIDKWYMRKVIRCTDDFADDGAAASA